MTNNERITAHNLLIDQAQAKVDALPTMEDLTAVLNEQDALITELEAALEGKAAGGGGGVPTCNVEFTWDSRVQMGCCGYSYTTVVGGKITSVYNHNTAGGLSFGTVENLVCGSYVYIYNPNYYPGGTTYTGDVEIVSQNKFVDSAGYVTVLRMPETDGATATVTLKR